MSVSKPISNIPVGFIAPDIQHIYQINSDFNLTNTSIKKYFINM